MSYRNKKAGGSGTQNPSLNSSNPSDVFHREMLQVFIDRFRKKETARAVYSYAVLAMTICFVAVVSTILWFLAKAPNDHVVAFIGAIVSLVGTIFGLPLFIMKSLFNIEEDKQFMDEMRAQLKDKREIERETAREKAEKVISDVQLD